MTTIAHDLNEAARAAAGNWRKFTCFVWFEKPEEPDDWAIVYVANRDSGPLERANAKAIAIELEAFGDDVREESHNHWAVGHVDGYAIRVYRDGNITAAFAKWVEIQDRLDDYPVLDEDLHSQEEQEEIDASWDAWVEHDFRRALEKHFGREIRDDANLFDLFNEQEPEWYEDCSGMTCNIKRCVERVKAEDVEPLFTEHEQEQEGQS